MEELFFSFIIPVFNRPNEIEELLQSLTKQTYTSPYEVVIVEDGSSETSEEVVKEFDSQLQLSYYSKPNSGPGDSRNYGMAKAKGNYFIILDSDCILPPSYLQTVHDTLATNFVHCYGGPDTAHVSFTNVQKAIDYTMTSFLTTGGIRGKKKGLGKFQPRSFNMGISKEVFQKVGGFGNIHPGEDPDLTLRIWAQGYDTNLIPEAHVYHKRRIDWSKFYTQVNKFGMVRPILNQWHPGSAKITYWFPTVFCVGFCVALICTIWGIWLPLLAYSLFFGLIFIHALWRTKKLGVALLALWATCIQFSGYGFGFLKSFVYITTTGRKPEELFPKLFFTPKI
jgi:glycosyltransferase involved in cell wall biosynthesis